MRQQFVRIFSTVRKRNKTFELLNQNSRWIIRWNSRYLGRETCNLFIVEFREGWSECIIIKEIFAWFLVTDISWIVVSWKKIPRDGKQDWSKMISTVLTISWSREKLENRRHFTFKIRKPLVGSRRCIRVHSVRTRNVCVSIIRHFTYVCIVYCTLFLNLRGIKSAFSNKCKEISRFPRES